jgi:hypothetical protein
MDITYFRQRKFGPEILIENVVAKKIPDLFPNGNRPVWMAGSIPIGAGMPDLLIASCEPQVFALAHVEIPFEQVLAYLRVVGRARLETITERIGRPRGMVLRCLNGLIEVNAVSKGSDIFSLAPDWRNILPEVIAIEVKVRNWQRAVAQASRNCIFTHRSFVAFPSRLAQRVQFEPVFRQFGVGLLSVSDDNEVVVLRRCRRSEPRVWNYYYRLAFLIANHFGRGDNAVCRYARKGQRRLS